MQSLHNHTWRCKHADGAMEAYIEAALAGGITDFGFSDHAPLPDHFVWNKWGVYKVRMNMAELPHYAADVLALREKYRDRAKIRLGIELEYVPQLHAEVMRELRAAGIEYFALGQHFLEDGAYFPLDPTESERYLCLYTEVLLEAASTGDFTFAAHPDLIHYNGSNRRLYIHEMTRLCEGLMKAGLPLEINLHGIDKERHYPSPLFWDIAGEMGAPAIIGLDAHHLPEVCKPELIAKGRAFAAAHHVNLLEGLCFDR